jgi:hypothetical protein
VYSSFFSLIIFFFFFFLKKIKIFKKKKKKKKKIQYTNEKRTLLYKTNPFLQNKKCLYIVDVRGFRLVCFDSIKLATKPLDNPLKIGRFGGALISKTKRDFVYNTKVKFNINKKL